MSGRFAWNVVMVATGLFVGLTGCAIPGHEMADRAALNASSAKDVLLAMKQDIVNTMSALHTLTERNQANLTDQFKQFTNSVTAAQSRASSLEKSGSTLSSSAEQYFAAWKTSIDSINNPEMKQRSETRRRNAEAMYVDVRESLSATMTAARRCVDDFQDISSVLANDLNRRGIDSIQGPDRTNRQGRQGGRDGHRHLDRQPRQAGRRTQAHRCVCIGMRRDHENRRTAAGRHRRHADSLCRTATAAV